MGRSDQPRDCGAKPAIVSVGRVCYTCSRENPAVVAVCIADGRVYGLLAGAIERQSALALSVESFGGGRGAVVVSEGVRRVSVPGAGHGHCRWLGSHRALDRS